MKFYKYILFYFLSTLLISSACENEGSEAGHTTAGEEEHHEDGHHEDGHHESGVVHFSDAQFRALDIQVGELPMRNLSSLVEANGQLEVPPQNEASVTAIMGANVASIEVIEGDDVKKGQVLAYLSHPNLTRLQSDYLEAYSRLQFLEQEFQRQKRLYEEEVGSGKSFQQTRADVRAKEAMVKSLASQLRQLGISPERVQQGNFYERVPVVSPIEGSITQVGIKTGQYVSPELSMFEIINTHHIHADLMVFEKDIYKVEKGQRVRFTVETLPGEELFANIYSVGKKFEQKPKAVHIHAEIENASGMLIPGMYIQGEVLTDSIQSHALPEAALAREGDNFVAFLAEQEIEGDNPGWVFKPVPLRAGITSGDWVAVSFLETVPEGARFALNNAYYLLAELNKGEAEHSH